MSTSETTSNPSNPEIIAANSQSLFAINMSHVTKLNSTNYLMWKLQVHSFLDGYALAGHLDGSKEIPAATLTTNDVVSVNPAYTLWTRQDRLIFSSLIGAISTPLQPLVSRATSSSEIWNTLASTYAKPSRGHIRQLKTQLKQWHKETKTIDVYVQGITTRLDQLAILGAAMGHEEQIDLILDGLPEEYKNVVDQVEGRDTPPTITELHERLLNHEAKLLSAMETLVPHGPVTANAAQHRNFSNNNKNQSRNRTTNNQWQHSPSSNWQSGQNRADSQGPRPYLGRCQICGIQGHSAKRCSKLQRHSAKRCSKLQSFQSSAQQQQSPFTSWQPRANLAMNSSYSADNWLLDSGATHHMTSDLHNLSLHQPYRGSDGVTIADGSTIPITQTGFKSFPSNSRDLQLHKVLYVPDLQKNLISVYRLCNTNRVSVEFFPASFQVKDLSTETPLLQGRTINELYEWPISSSSPTAFAASPSSTTTLQSWHSRLGHPSSLIFNNIVSRFSIPISKQSSQPLSCSDCFINKTHKIPFSKSTITSSKPLEYIYSDVWSSPILSLENFKYYLIFVDHYTRYTWLYPLKLKSQVKDTFIAFKSLVENRFQTRIGTLYSDNGGEYIALRGFLSTHGISHFTSPPHTPEHNGLSERKHRHIVEMGLTLLSTASVPKKYWSFAFATAVDLINRLPTPLLHMQSPFQKLFGTDPNYDKLRVFGSACYPWLRPYNRHKLEDKAAQCAFMGYSPTQSAYYCLHIPIGRMYVSRHVQFDEGTFPFANLKLKAPPTITFDEERNWDSHTTLVPSTVVPSLGPHPAPPPTSVPSSPTQVLSSCSPHSSFSSPSEPTTPLQNGSKPTAQHPLISQPTNQIQFPNHYQPINHIDTNEPTYHTNHTDNIDQTPQTENTNHIEPTSPTISTSSPTETPKSPNTKSLNSSPTKSQPQSINQTPNLTSSSSPVSPSPPPKPVPQRMATRSVHGIIKPTKKLNLIAAITSPSDIEPRTASQALKDERWRKAMGLEYNAQLDNHSWDLVPPPPPQVTRVGCKWIFTKKYNSDGSLNRHKARLVAQGYNQRPGIDYAETFSPVIKSTTIRLVLGVAVGRSWPIKQLDVNNAFLQGTLTDEVYMNQPPGFIDRDKPDHVCRLRKAIYGLKQAPRAWYIELRNYLISVGFVNSVSDTSLFILQQGKSIVYMLIYVDDILVTGNDNNLLQHTLDALASRFSVKDPEDLHYFLGIEARRSSQGLHLSQRKYINDLLARTNMLLAKPVLTPMATSPKLSLYSGTHLSDPTEYRAILGSLQYLSFTRPDLCYAVNKLSQYMHSPTSDHWSALKRLLRYLAGTTDHGIFLQKGTTLTLHAYSDADWAGDKDDYVSTNGYIVYLGSHPLSWSSKKQKGIARSSTEAEYRSVANTAAEVKWLCSLLGELGITLTHPPVIYCDNVGATYLCANPVFHSRMKHIALDYHFIRNQVQSGALRVVHVSTHDQLADVLTKPLSRMAFNKFSSKIGVTRVPPSCGGVTGTPLLQGRTINELYEWPISSSSPTAFAASPSSTTTLQSWHSRLGHPSSLIFNNIVSRFSIPISKQSSQPLSCSDCFINKTHKIPFSKSTITSSKPLEYIYSDVWSSHIYYLIFVDHYTRYTWLYPLKLKSQVKDTFIAFKSLVENRFQTRIGTLYSDNGGEYIALRGFLSTHSISHFTSPPHTPEHNGLSERKHRHIVEMGLTLLSTASVPKKYWSFAFATAVYLINRLPTPVLHMQSPFQKLFGTDPNYDKLRVFGSACYPWLRPYNRHKLEDKAAQCAFMGYSPTQSAYYCLHIPTGRMYVSRHVQFDEGTFPFANLKLKAPPTITFDEERNWDSHTTLVPSTVVPSLGPHPAPPPTSVPSSPTQVLSSYSPHSSFSSPSEPTAPLQNGSKPMAQHPLISQPTNQTQIPNQSQPINHINTNEPTYHTNHTDNIDQTPQTENTNHIEPTSPTISTSSPTETPKSPNTKSLNSSPTKSQPQFINQTPNLTSSSSPVSPSPPPKPVPQRMATRSVHGIIKPTKKLNLIAAITSPSDIEPRTASQALKDERWRKAMGLEYNAQLDNHSWDLVPPPPPQVTRVGCKWIFT
ncbi:hypothetical protein AALP_AA1G251100, partial [Arabis alpina]